MNFKRKRVVGACFRILFLLVFVPLLLYILQQVGTGFCSKLLEHGKVRVKEINDAFRLDLDTLQTYDIVMDYSGMSSEGGGGVDRRKLVGMPDARGLLQIPHKVYLSGYWPVGKEVLVSESSFAVSFTMSLYQPSWKDNKTINQSSHPAGLAFIVLPPYQKAADEGNLTEQLGLGADGSLNLSSSIARTAHFPGGGQVSVQTGRLPNRLSSLPLIDPNGPLLVVHVSVMEPTPPAAGTARYTVWIEYARLTQSLSVYVGAGEVKERPDDAVAIKKNISYLDGNYWDASFGLYSSAGQLLQVHSWSSDVDGATYLMKYIMDNYLHAAAIFLALILSLAATVAAAAVSGVAWYFRTKQRRWKKEQKKLAKIMQSLPGVPMQVDFSDIKKATFNFQEASKLGKGGFSSVYRCRLPAAAACGGRSSSYVEVAVKKFTRGVEEQRYEDFLAEVSIINRLRHKNVVPLVEPLLIYEYMTNGSLDQHLFRRDGNNQEQQDDTSSSIRQWGTRYSIATDIATGLHYVHHEHEPMVLHRDIKASNIMFDSNFRARLGDFGIACTVADDRTSVTGVAGTWGYIAPDYAMSNRATRQTDIYAFGVLVLELVTGKKNRDVPADDGHISDWVWRLLGEGRLLDAVDDHQEAIVADEAERLLLLGLACTNPNPSNRPSMAVAVQVITKLAPPPDVPPERPAFVWPPREWRSSLDSEYDCTITTESTVELVQIMQDQRPSEIQNSTITSVSM
nr:unnamed protein product [Digitaria exilis]